MRVELRAWDGVPRDAQNRVSGDVSGARKGKESTKERCGQSCRLGVPAG